MKSIIQVLLALSLLVVATLKSLESAGRYFIKDVIELHGSAVFSSDIQFKSYNLNWKDRSLMLDGVCVSSTKKTNVVCADTINLHLQGDIAPSFGSSSFMPDVWLINTVNVGNISVFYNVDNEAGDFLEMRRQVSEAAAIGMRDRLNADANNVDAPLKFRIDRLNVSGIKVKATSQQYPELSKDFAVKDLPLEHLGLSEGGITAAEVIDRVIRVFFDEVQSEAQRQLEVRRPAAGENLSRKRISRKENKEVKEAEDKGAGKDIKELWQKTKSFFE